MYDGLIKQADKALKEGKKSLKTGLFKWKPEYVEAVSSFEEAGKCYKNSKKWHSAIDAYQRASECNKKLSDAWGTARNLEAIVEIQIDNPETIKKIDDLISTTRDASLYFKASEGYNNSQKLYVKLATYLAKIGETQTAIEVSKQGYEDSIESDKKYNVSEILPFYIEILVQNQMYAQAIDIYKQQIQILKNLDTKTPLEQHGLLIICLCLIMDESIRAENELNFLMQEIPNFTATSEYLASNRMLQLYENGEQQEFEKLVSRPPVNLQFPVIIPRLVKKLKCKQMLIQQQQQPQTQSEEQKEEQIEQNLEQAQQAIENMVL